MLFWGCPFPACSGFPTPGFMGHACPRGWDCVSGVLQMSRSWWWLTAHPVKGARLVSVLAKVVVDLKTAITLKPEARTKWLSKAGSSVPLNNILI